MVVYSGYLCCLVGFNLLTRVSQQQYYPSMYNIHSLGKNLCTEQKLPLCHEANLNTCIISCYSDVLSSPFFPLYTQNWRNSGWIDQVSHNFLCRCQLIYFLLCHNSAFHCGTVREESERSISAARPQKSEPIEKSDGLNLFRLARSTAVIIVGHFNQMVASPWALSVRLDVFKRTEESSKLQMGKKQTIEEGMVGKAIVMISLCSVFFNKLSLSVTVLLLSILERIIYSSNNRSTLLLFVTPCVRNPRTKHLCSAATKYF